MGQRHQVYLRLPAQNWGKNNPNNCDEKTEAIHHQWLYGRTALKLLINYLTFLKADENNSGNDQFAKKYDALEKLAACYSCIPSEGYYHGVYQFDQDTDKECLADPRLGDNNDGITIIDIAGDKIKYCFMNIGHIEGQDGHKCPVLKPLSAKEYVTYYYPDWQNGKVRADKKMVDAPEIKEEILALLKYLNNYEVLKLSRVKKIFPKMFEGE